MIVIIIVNSRRAHKWTKTGLDRTGSAIFMAMGKVLWPVEETTHCGPDISMLDTKKKSGRNSSSLIFEVTEVKAHTHDNVINKLSKKLYHFED